MSKAFIRIRTKSGDTFEGCIFMDELDGIEKKISEYIEVNLAPDYHIDTIRIKKSEIESYSVECYV